MRISGGGAAAKLRRAVYEGPAGLARPRKEYGCWSCELRACALQILAWYKMVGSSLVKSRSRGGFVRSVRSMRL